MELINNKYKIIKKIEQNRRISSYAVQDIVDKKIRKLIIINSDYLSKTLINFLINNFIDLSNVETSGILKVFDFGLVSSIDNKKLTYKQYYYTSEYLQGYYKINDCIDNISSEEMIDIYIQVCKAINYISLRGIKYEEINFENILLYKKENKVKVKLMDLVTLEVESSYLKGEIKGGLIFKAPEILNGESSTIESEVYSLGVLALILFFMKSNIKVDFKTDIHSAIDDNKLDFDKLCLNGNIKNIIKRMISNNPKERYHSINDIFNDINKSLGIKYLPYDINEIEKINVKIPIVDREYELKTIISEYRFMKEKDRENKCIFVHGETGIGKTKILKEVERLLKLDGVNVYSTFPSSNHERNKNFVDFGKRIIYSCKEKIGDTYKEEFEKFFPQMEEDKTFISLEGMTSFHEKVRLFKIVENFIKEIFKEKASVIIIDNVSAFKKISLEALEYVYNSKSIKNLVLILSYNEEDLLDPMFFNFVNKINKNNSTTNVPLKGLSFEGTACLIEKLLGLSEYPIRFSKKIYSETYGNPLFIEETIKNLLLNEIIYVQESTGKWGIAYDGDYDSLPMPRSIEQAFISELNKIGAESYFILEFISIFTDGVSQSIIEEFMKKDGLNYDYIMEDLTSKGILCRKIEDSGFIYDFCSKILKDLVYEKVDEKVEMHREAVELLIEFEENNIENRQEIIYHLEKSNQNVRAVEYYIENASKMISLRNHREALFNLKKASQLLPYRYNDEKTNILLKMADIYMDLFKFKSAQKVLDSAKNIILETNNKKHEIDLLNREGNIYLNQNNYSIALEKINLVNKILGEVSYKKGFIDSRIVLSNIYYKIDEFDKVVETCNEGIEACGDEFIKPKVVLYNIRGKGNMYLKKFDDAVRDYGLVYNNSKSKNYKKGIVFAYINLAKIYEDYYQISDIAEEYLLQVTKICEKNKFLYYEIIALQKLGEIYNRRFEYNKALDIFKDTLYKSEFIEYKDGIVQSLSYIGILQLKLSNYKEVFKNVALVEKYIERNKTSIENIHQYYLLKGEVLLEIGFLKEAKEYLYKALKAYEKEKSLLKLRIEELLVFIKLKDEYGEINMEEYINHIKDIANRYKNYSNKSDFIYSCAIILREQGYSNYASKLVDYVYEDNWISISEYVKFKELYFKGIVSREDEKLAFLYEALKSVEHLNNKKIQCNIYIKLADYFNEKAQHNFAAYYYFEACEIIREVIHGIPHMYKLKYFNFNKFIKPFEKINFLKNEYFLEKKYDDEFYEKIKIDCEKDLNELLKFKKFMYLLDNKKFMKSMGEIYNEFFSIRIKHQKDIISNLQCDSIKNLKLIIQYIASKTLATEAEIVIENGQNNFKTIASLTGNCIREGNKEIIERVKKTKSTFYVFNNEVYFTNFKYKASMDIKRALMCIPIMLYPNENLNFTKEKRHIKRNPIINGYIYISSTKFLNNINQHTLNEIMKLINLMAYIIDKYQLTINCSIDKLTGAYTRKYLEDKLSESIECANFNNDKFSIIMFDLDHFKSVNDTFGHQVGDKVLNNVCNIVMDNLREGDVCGRYGGEEFIVILPGIGEDKALNIAERIRIDVEKRKILGEKHPVTISIGISTYPKQAQLKRELIEKADQALYMAKDSGRNQCKVWKKEFENKVKVTSKLTGIISGNFAQDSRNVLAMIELMDIINSDEKFEQKVYKALGHITGITEVEYANLIFLTKDHNIKENFGRKKLQEDWSYEYVCNDKIIKDVISQKQGTCIMEWNETFNSDLLTVLPEWYSVMVVPIINKNFMKGILYLAVPSKIKKFTREELNFVTILSKIIKDI